MSGKHIQTTLKATDNLVRELPVSDIVGDVKPNKQVGLFYFLWLGEHDFNDDNRSRIAPPLDVTYEFMSTTDFYTKGDCAPIGRLNYVFKT